MDELPKSIRIKVRCNVMDHCDEVLHGFPEDIWIDIDWEIRTRALEATTDIWVELTKVIENGN